MSADSPSLSFTVDTVAPSVANALFVYDSGLQHLAYMFSEPVTDVPDASVALTNLTTTTSIPTANVHSTHSVADADSITFPGYAYGALPDGDYTASLGGDIEDAAGNPLAANTLDFFFINGDANHDRKVNLLDFNALAGDFNGTSKTFSQGDFNYDGTVNLLDFNLLAGKFNTSLDGANAVSNAVFSTTKIGGGDRMIEALRGDVLA